MFRKIYNTLLNQGMSPLITRERHLRILFALEVMMTVATAILIMGFTYLVADPML